MTVPFGHSEYQGFSESSGLSLFFTYRVLCSLKISEIPFWWMFKTKCLRFRATCGVNWHAFGLIRVFTKYSIYIYIYFFFFTYSTLSSFKISENLESRLQEKSMLDFGSNFGHMQNFVKWDLLPFLFTYFDLLSSKNSDQIPRTK